MRTLILVTDDPGVVPHDEGWKVWRTALGIARLVGSVGGHRRSAR
jgi:hypothetical protein